MTEAADVLGYSVNSLRRIVDRSRRKARGQRVRGPTVKFFQATRNSQILFRERWLIDFIDACTVDPNIDVDESRGPARRSSLPPSVTGKTTSGLDARLLDL